jgi:hypothetical protein
MGLAQEVQHLTFISSFCAPTMPSAPIYQSRRKNNYVQAESPFHDCILLYNHRWWKSRIFFSILLLPGNALPYIADPNIQRLIGRIMYKKGLNEVWWVPMTAGCDP